MHQIDWDISGIHLRLLAGRGLYWPRGETLFVADLHLGKEATFASHKIAIPRGSSAETLQRVGSMLQQSCATRLCILGDLFHERTALAPDILDHFKTFRDAHHAVAMRLVLGNHDRGVQDVQSELGIAVCRGPLNEPPFTLAHYPDAPMPGSQLTLAGHLHPALRINLPQFAARRAPCFYLRASCLTLPAAGDFTGTAVVTPSRDDRIAIVLEGQIVDLQQRTT